jgi:hypothetical protein
MTREQLAAAAAEKVGLPELFDFVAKGNWGTALKPSAFRGDLCFGPNNGKNVTFVNPRKWIGNWEEIDPDAAFQEVARRYLRAYGPVTPREFTRWWNMGGVSVGNKLFNQLGDEVETVDVEGREAVGLKSALDEMQEAAVSGVVRLLPLFDAYVLDLGRGNETLLPKEHHKRVYRNQGWTSAVVLVDGYMKGVWEAKAQSKQTAIRVTMFDPPAKQIKIGIEAEAERLGEFWGSKVVVEYA